MATIRISQALAIAGANLWADAVDAGTGPAGSIVLYDGTMPADVDTPVTTQQALVHILFGKPAFADAVPSVLGATAGVNTVATVPGEVDGDAAWARIYNTDGTPLYDVDVTDGDGDGMLKISATHIVPGVNVTVLSLNMTQRKA